MKTGNIYLNGSREQMKELIEAYIDSRGIADIMGILSGICHEKESHVLENWQDAHLAQQWRKIANYINAHTEKIAKLSPLG